jgi:hypothetical protein
LHEAFEAASGISPTKPVASRWFNLMTIISETAGDVWVHREIEQLWWTVSKPDGPEITLETDPRPKRYLDPPVISEAREEWRELETSAAPGVAVSPSSFWRVCAIPPQPG